jgi:acylphosphatase
VKNLPDGRVEVCAEGAENDLKEFLSKIKQYFARYIIDADIDWLNHTDEFKDFGIRF